MISPPGIEAVAVIASVIMQCVILKEMKEASRQMRRATFASLKSLEMATCPVLTLRLEPDGSYSIQNCGRGPAIMAQWGYGKAVSETLALHRLPDNIIPANSTKPIVLDMNIAWVSGILLFAYSVTNDKYITTIKWGAGDMMIVNFGSYTGKMPNNPLQTD